MRRERPEKEETGQECMDECVVLRATRPRRLSCERRRKRGRSELSLESLAFSDRLLGFVGRRPSSRTISSAVSGRRRRRKSRERDYCTLYIRNLCLLWVSGDADAAELATRSPFISRRFHMSMLNGRPLRARSCEIFVVLRDLRGARDSVTSVLRCKHGYKSQTIWKCIVRRRRHVSI